MKIQVIWVMSVYYEEDGCDQDFTTTEHFGNFQEAKNRFDELVVSDEALNVKIVEVIEEYNFN